MSEGSHFAAKNKSDYVLGRECLYNYIHWNLSSLAGKAMSKTQAVFSSLDPTSQYIPERHFSSEMLKLEETSWPKFRPTNLNK